MTLTPLRMAVVWLVVVGCLVAACTSDAPEAAEPTIAPSTTTPAPEPAPGSSPEVSMGAEDTANLRLPDLTTTTPDEIYIEQDLVGTRLLRFSTLVQNIGEGPLELIGVQAEGADHVDVTQVIQQHDGPPVERDGGRLVMSDEHAHWHLESFALFELWPLDESADAGLPPLTQSKITFCLLDEVRIEPELPIAEEGPQFLECGWEAQGISAGWQETYVAQLPGQHLDVTDLPDGDYVLSTTLDPDGLLYEADTENNTAVVVIRIADNAVEVIEER